MVAQSQSSKKKTVSRKRELVFKEQYAGDGFLHIDEYQEEWRKTLNLGFPGLSVERLCDLLVCCRESVLNAMVHGCRKNSKMKCEFEITLSPRGDCLQITVRDPGEGHNFNVNKRESSIDSLEGKHMGLVLVKHLSDDLSFENNGSTIVFDFQLSK